MLEKKEDLDVLSWSKICSMVGRLREPLPDKDNTHRGCPPVLPGSHEVVEDVPELVGVGGARVVPHRRQQPEPVENYD